MKIRKVIWNAYCSWKWNVDKTDDCSICQNEFDKCCGECNLSSENCPPVEGVCSHLFHLHCIENWLSKENKPICPNCKQQWEVKRYFSNTIEK